MQSKVFNIVSLAITFKLINCVQSIRDAKVRKFMPETHNNYHHNITRGPIKVMTWKTLNANDPIDTTTEISTGTPYRNFKDYILKRQRFKPVEADRYRTKETFRAKEGINHADTQLDDYKAADRYRTKETFRAKESINHADTQLDDYKAHTKGTTTVTTTEIATFTPYEITEYTSPTPQSSSLSTEFEETTRAVNYESVPWMTSEPPSRVTMTESYWKPSTKKSNNRLSGDLKDKGDTEQFPTNLMDKLHYKRTDDDNLKPSNCPNFKPSKIPFELRKMEDIWQTMYYRLTEQIKCFQIVIKGVSQVQREAYSRKYGNFSGVVNWRNVRLEIAATTNIGRKHFLEGKLDGNGILKNIIIARDVDSGNIDVQEEDPDQWLVVRHLLLMRDCETGGIVVFSKVPYVPRRREIEEALAKFNEGYADGKLACDEDEVINKSFEVEDDVQSFWNS